MAGNCKARLGPLPTIPIRLTTACSIVGAENGIYEFHVHMLARKLYPSVTLR